MTLREASMTIYGHPLVSGMDDKAIALYEAGRLHGIRQGRAEAYASIRGKLQDIVSGIERRLQEEVVQ
jgi:hypothetical protein